MIRGRNESKRASRRRGGCRLRGGWDWEFRGGMSGGVFEFLEGRFVGFDWG